MELPYMADPNRFRQDLGGQWWYYWGKVELKRQKVSVMKCPRCGRDFLPCGNKVPNKAGVFFCTKKCGVQAFNEREPGRFAGERAGRWKGGRRTTARGYVVVLSRGHPSIKYGKRIYVLEHRLIMEAHLGRYLEANEIVHHKNGIKDDNRLENLELWVGGHPPGQREKERPHCETCHCFEH